MLDDALKAEIQAAYSRFLESRGLKARYGQRLMIATLARGLAAVESDDKGQRSGPPVVVAVEAGTGTGKTVAYSLAAIPLARAMGKRLVIATATVALQEQIVNKDLPDLIAHSGLEFSVVLAKGRGRYLCMSKLDTLMQEGASRSAMAPLFAEAGIALDDPSAQVLYTRMLEALSSRAWDGDRDNWPEMIPEPQWRSLTTDHHQCSNRYCPYFQQCAFFRAREGITRADVIVTNHDLVLADLALGGGAVLPAPADTLYVLDEGHHLPDKAIAHFAHTLRLRSGADWLGQMDKQLTRLLVQHPLPGEWSRMLELVPPLARQLQEQHQWFYTACAELPEFQALPAAESGERPQLRFAQGRVPEHLRELAHQLGQGYARLEAAMARLADLLREALDDKSGSVIPSTQAEEWHPVFGALLGRTQAHAALWSAFSAEDAEDEPPFARWLARVEGGDIEVCASPILAASTLRQHLWSRAHAAVVTSATLSALGSFDRYRQRAGLPRDAVTETFPSPFPYAEAARLHIPRFANPKDARAHTQAIIEALPGLLDGPAGSLVLFSSRRQMQDVYEVLADALRERILMQGQLSMQETLALHRQRVDEGMASVLFGLASLAEGVDLPGAYCEHVIIAKIPFAVPNDPVEATLAEWIEARGGNPFMEISVPDAAVRLVQASGRLLRTETDRGRVTILDSRLLGSGYGRAMLAALPPFAREF